MRWPDFLIIGAQKCGTSSLHHLLAHHPQVHIPDGEIFFFDIDDQEQHPDFFAPGATIDFDANVDLYTRWYASHFEGARSDQLLGEDSTTYLASSVAPTRAARFAPDARLIVMLRDPVARAYSHYWHSVSTGRATLPFARQVTERPGNLVRRGEYAPQLRRWLKHFDRDRLLAVFFEDFVRDPQNTVDRCMRFLGIDTMIDVSTIDSHRNPSWPPLSLRGRLALNAAMPWLMRKRYRGFLPEPAAGRVTRRERQLLPARVAEPLQSAVNALRPRKRFPPMDDASRQALSEHFARVNAGLDELVGRDLSEIWPSAR